MARETTRTYAEDERFMARALALAERGAGWTSPNPLVGAVIVKDGRIIGEGWHTAFGRPHAEREALAACTEDPAGSTLYATLEPCCHWGKTPPCTDAVMEAGVARVVVGGLDPNPLVAGRGCTVLREAGIAVDEGVLAAECRRLNEVFFHFITTGRPFVAMKYAMTLDGKVATRTGASRWITGPEAREQVHGDRHRFAAIMVGIGTALADDPALTCRLDGGPWLDPVRVVVDSRARLPLNSKLVCTAGDAPVLVAVAAVHLADGDVAARVQRLREAGCVVWVSPEAEGAQGHVHLPSLLEYLGSQGIDSVLAEGGPALHGALAEAGLVNRVQAYVAPKLFGGAAAPGPVGGLGVADPAGALRLAAPRVTPLGDDLLLECAVEREVPPCSPAL